jgi:hypothetical protein
MIGPKPAAAAMISAGALELAGADAGRHGVANLAQHLRGEGAGAAQALQLLG